MPHPRRHPLPPIATREALAESRRAGLDFATAWDLAVGAHKRPGTVRMPHQTVERHQWREALEASREEFKAAYDGEETPLSLALAAASEDDASEFAVRAGMGPLRLGHVLPVASISRQLPPVGAGRGRLPDWGEFSPDHPSRARDALAA